jgi:hypothetical protein
MKLRNKLLSFISLLILIPSSGCGIYSFTGANISPDIKTISIDYFFNEAGDGPPVLGQQFTENLKDYYQNNTSLAMDNTGNGDIQLSGAISGFRYAPIVATSSGDKNQPDVAGLQRLTITIKVTYTDTKNDENSFDKTFSFYADYNPSTVALTQIEPQLIEDIFKNIVLDIFNATVANW